MEKLKIRSVAEGRKNLPENFKLLHRKALGNDFRNRALRSSKGGYNEASEQTLSEKKTLRTRQMKPTTRILIEIGKTRRKFIQSGTSMEFMARNVRERRHKYGTKRMVWQLVNNEIE